MRRDFASSSSTGDDETAYSPTRYGNSAEVTYRDESEESFEDAVRRVKSESKQLQSVSGQKKWMPPVLRALLEQMTARHEGGPTSWDRPPAMGRIASSVMGYLKRHDHHPTVGQLVLFIRNPNGTHLFRSDSEFVGDKGTRPPIVGGLDESGGGIKPTTPTWTAWVADLNEPVQAQSVITAIFAG